MKAKKQETRGHWRVNESSASPWSQPMNYAGRAHLHFFRFETL